MTRGQISDLSHSHMQPPGPVPALHCRSSLHLDTSFEPLDIHPSMAMRGKENIAFQLHLLSLSWGYKYLTIQDKQPINQSTVSILPPIQEGKPSCQ